jgi:hypothetical protein
MSVTYNLVIIWSKQSIKWDKLNMIHEQLNEKQHNNV